MLSCSCDPTQQPARVWAHLPHGKHFICNFLPILTPVEAKFEYVFSRSIVHDLTTSDNRRQIAFAYWLAKPLRQQGRQSLTQGERRGESGPHGRVFNPCRFMLMKP